MGYIFFCEYTEQKGNIYFLKNKSWYESVGKTFHKVREGFFFKIEVKYTPLKDLKSNLSFDI